MSASESSSKSDRGRIGWKLTLLICSLILLAGAGLTVLIFSTEPTATRTTATKETAMLVAVAPVERGNFRPTIVALGTVEPARDIVLSPRVSGEIVEIAENFIPGGFAGKGQALLQIDPADFENALEQRESQLQEAIADLNIEMGRQNVAQKDYELLDQTLSGASKDLVLRKPQLNAARARVTSARAARDQARLELERTTVKAPFDAHILTRNANVGSQVSPGENLGRIVGVHTYWVAATVPLSRLRWLSFPDAEGEKGSAARIRNRSAWTEGEYRSGRLHKLVGTLEDQTRMARVLVSVPDPLSREPESAGLPRLMIGAYVEARIEANEIPDVVRLNRDWLRQGDTVWVMTDGKLAIRDVEIVLKDEQYAYIRSGLNEKDKVVTTNLSTVVEGAKLRVKASENE